MEIVDLSAELFDHGNGSAFDLGLTYSSLGQTGEAMKYLEIAYERHDLALAGLALRDGLRPLHDKQDFRELVAKIGLPPVK